MNEDLTVNEVSKQTLPLSERIGNFFAPLFDFLTQDDSLVWKLISPFKYSEFFSKSKYKLVRLFSALSRWIVFPYTIVAACIYALLWVVMVLALISGLLTEYAEDKIDKLKTFWKNV